MKSPRISRRLFLWVLLVLCLSADRAEAQKSRRPLDNNLRCVDLSDLKKALLHFFYLDFVYLPSP